MVGTIGIDDMILPPRVEGDVEPAGNSDAVMDDINAINTGNGNEAAADVDDDDALAGGAEVTASTEPTEAPEDGQNG